MPREDGTKLQSPRPAPFLTLGTRGSPLALAQAHMVRAQLAERHGIAEDEIHIEIIRTDGDRTQAENLSLKDIGGKGLFSKEIEQALIEGRIDVGVHSAKDMATVLPGGLTMPVYLPREDVRDAFICLSASSLDELPQGARIGTSSLRRAAQMRNRRPDLEILEFRGNVATRLEKLKSGVADATLLAMAGLNRLGLSDKATAVLDPALFPPAPAQGAIGLELRENDASSLEKISPLNHAPTQATLTAERAMLRTLDGSCRTPIGVHTRAGGDQLTLNGQVLSPDGLHEFTATVIGSAANAEALGIQLGESLIAQAGERFFAQLRAL